MGAIIRIIQILQVIWLVIHKLIIVVVNIMIKVICIRYQCVLILPIILVLGFVPRLILNLHLLIMFAILVLMAN